MDTLIRGGRLIDGSGNPWRYADIAIADQRIRAIAPPGLLDPAGARTVIDATGHIVCPGFIDIQSHSIIPFLSDGRAISKVTQGVTTEIMGELWTPGPFGGLRQSPFLSGFGVVSAELEREARQWTRFGHWMDAMLARGVSVNVGSFLGGATVREFAMGWRDGAPSADELKLMRRATSEAMADGAFGIAPALIYPPSSFSPDEELIAGAAEVGRAGGVYIVHMRSEGSRLLESIADNVHLSRTANCPVEIYHLKVTGAANWPLMERAVAAIAQARADGVDIAANMYPYVASGTGLAAAMPDWVQADGKFEQNLRDPATRQRITAEMLGPNARGTMAGPDGVLVVGLRRAEHQQYNGKTLDVVATMRGEAWTDTLMNIVLSEGPWAAAIYFLMNEANLPLQMRQPWVKFSTDAPGIDPSRPDRVLVHPRAYGTYTRILGRYVREQGVMTWEDAIRKMTSSVADRLYLHGRGEIRIGFQADVVVFNPETVIDRATFIEPHQVSVGIRDVWVNGTRVLQNGTHTGAKPGQALYGPART
ncbi:MAG: amidohydrolase family protein [Chloroflexi bacterium]|nr:amidohydrolase family protein [Chloroflexota bacterium]